MMVNFAKGREHMAFYILGIIELLKTSRWGTSFGLLKQRFIQLPQLTGQGDMAMLAGRVVSYKLPQHMG